MENRCIKFLIFIAIVAFAVPQIALAAWWNPFSWNWGRLNSIFHFQRTEQKQNKDGLVACTMDAKQCPDGSYVSRIPPNCEFKPCPETKKDPTANWKTYTSDKWGFEIKYPNDWSVFWSEWTPGGAKYHAENISRQGIIILAEKQPKDFVDLEVANVVIELQNSESLSKNSNTVDDFWNKLGKKDEVTGEIINRFVEKKTINGVSFIFFEQYNWNVKNQKKIWEPQSLFMYKGNFFWVRGNTIDKELFTQIISTFKFTK